MIIDEFLSDFEPSKTRFFGREIKDLNKDQLLRLFSFMEQEHESEINRIKRSNKFMSDINK